MLGTAFYTELQDTKDLENFIGVLLHIQAKKRKSTESRPNLSASYR